MKALKLMLIFLLIFSYCQAQKNTVERIAFTKAGTFQIKESANFGLVFTGPVIDYGMTWNILNDKRLIICEYEVGVGIPFSKKIASLGIFLKPVDAAYMFKIPLPGNKFYLGPAIKLEYNYNLYPELQSAYDYWFTNLSFGIGARYDFNYMGSLFRINLNSSFFGSVSRQKEYRDPYFYDIGFKYAVKHINQDLGFASVSDFNNTSMEILWKPKLDSRFSFGIFLKNSVFYPAPEIIIRNFGVKIVIIKKNI